MRRLIVLLNDILLLLYVQRLEDTQSELRDVLAELEQAQSTTAGLRVDAASSASHARAYETRLADCTVELDAARAEIKRLKQEVAAAARGVEVRRRSADFTKLSKA